VRRAQVEEVEGRARAKSLQTDDAVRQLEATVELYPIVTFQYSSTTLYQVSDHIRYLFLWSDNRI
jgi:hypothetical protein